MTKEAKGSKDGKVVETGWVEVEPPEEKVWQPTAKGETVTGKLLGFRTVQTKFGERALCELLTPDARLTVWCPTKLRSLMEQVAEFPGPGCEVRIRYEGQDKPGKGGRQGAHQFKVAVRGGTRPAE